jgi:hypothetical protein
MPLGVYEESAVAFIDILGFKNALADEAKARGILDVLSHVKEKVEMYYSDPLREQWQGILDIELTAVSDSIIISGSEGQTIIVLFAALEFSQLLLEKGFLCRGAVACGDLYHKNGIVFGAAFVNAYESEKRQAIYPRIIVDDKTMSLFEDSRNAPGDFCELIKEDKDGRKFVNILYQHYESNQDIEKILSEFVYREIDQNKDSERIMSKLRWLKNEYRL